MILAGARLRLGIAIAALGAGCAHAAPANDLPSSPLLEYAATQHFEFMANEQIYRSQEQGARHDLESNPPPTQSCAGTLGASRYADMLADLADAQAGLGEHAAAATAYTRAIACAPRRARLRGHYAQELLNLARLAAARSAALRGLALDANDYTSRSALAQLDFIEGHWTDAAARMRELAGSAEGVDVSTYWQIMLWVTQRRAGSSAPELHARALATDWPRPVLETLRGKQNEAQVLAAIKDKRDPQRRREMLCEALYYLGEEDFARGEAILGERRLAAAITLRVLYFNEHQLAVAELRKAHAPAGS